MDGISSLIDIGGRRLFVECAGVGAPTVVLEAGLGDSCDTWDPIWPKVAEITRACRYDRAGRGQSDPAPIPRTSHDMAADLHALVHTAVIPGPYVLVGHSMGGHTARVFWHQHPDEVVGMVLIDASHPDVRDGLLALLPPPEPDESETMRKWRAPLDPAANWEHFDNETSWRQVKDTGTLDGLPLVVLSAGKPKHWPSDLPADVVRECDRLVQILQEDLARLSSNSTHMIAEQSDHYVHHDQPELALDAIRRVVKAARERLAQ